MNTKKCKNCGSNNIIKYGNRPKMNVGMIEYCFCKACKKFFMGDKS